MVEENEIEKKDQIDPTPETEVSSDPVTAPEAEITPEAPASEEVVASPSEESTEPTSEEASPKRIVIDHTPVAHDDFDWSVGKRARQRYSEEEQLAMEVEYDSTFTSITEHEIISGTVSAITNSDVVLDIGFKSDGLISASEFRDTPDLKIGDVVEVYVEEKEDVKGQLVLSRRKAKLLRAWEAIVDAHNNDTVLTGTVTSKTKGGLIADVYGLETFLPGSQIDVKPIIDYDAYVGVKMEFKVVKINEAIKNAVVSHKALIESDLEAQRMEIISKLEKGQVLEGIIKNITDFGAFIDLGGVDGLLYITDISWGRISHPSELLELNQKLNVVVLDFDDDKKRISLGLKQLQPHPWDVLAQDIVVGSKVNGKIVNIEDYGAFLEITPGVEGLIHVSEVSWSNQPINPREYFKVGDNYEAIVVTIDREDRKMSLSIKQLTPDPWMDISNQFPIGSKHSGEVKNITPYGVFVELSEGIGGMAHISDLSWTKRYNHPSEFTRVGEKLDVVVLEIDQEARKLSLGHKQIEEDPWDTFAEVFPVGSKHQGTIIKKDDKGAIVSLPYGLEAFAPNRFLKKEDGASAQLDETMDFSIREFDRNDKRIIISHMDVWKVPTAEELKESASKSSGGGKKRRDRSQGSGGGGRVMTGPKVEKSTLGDLGVLGNLKKEMEKSEGKADSKAKLEEPKADAPVEEVVETPAAPETPETPADSADTPTETPNSEDNKDESAE